MMNVVSLSKKFLLLLLKCQFVFSISFCSGSETSRIGSQELGIFEFDVSVFFHNNILILFFVSLVLVVFLTLKFRQTLKKKTLLTSNTISQKGIKKVKDLLFLFEEFKKNKPLMKKILLVCSLIALICLYFGFTRPASSMLAFGISRLISDISDIQTFQEDVRRYSKSFLHRWFESSPSEIWWFILSINIFLFISFIDLVLSGQSLIADTILWEEKAFFFNFLLVVSRIVIVSINAHRLFYREIGIKLKLTLFAVSILVSIIAIIIPVLFIALSSQYPPTALGNFLRIYVSPGFAAASLGDLALNVRLRSLPSYKLTDYLIPGTRILDHEKMVCCIEANKVHFDREEEIRILVKAQLLVLDSK